MEIELRPEFTIEQDASAGYWFVVVHRSYRRHLARNGIIYLDCVCGAAGPCAFHEDERHADQYRFASREEAELALCKHKLLMAAGTTTSRGPT